MKKLDIEIEFYGAFARHNYPCPIYSHTEKAVFICHEGRFDVSWLAQKDGWKIIKADKWWKKAMVKLINNAT